jgi:pimeloyl-ACP methyl ester carboxylesterase
LLDVADARTLAANRTISHEVNVMEYGDLNERCLVKGQGMPVVLVHGMGGPKVWNPILKYLTKEYQIIIPIFPGYLAKDMQIKYSDELFVDFLEKIREHYKIDEWNVVGLSMGGRTVINYVLKHEKKVRKLILIDSVGIGDMSPLFRIPILKNIFPWLLRQILSNPKNSIQLGLEDFNDKNSEVFKRNMEWFIEMMNNEVIRYNFAEILTKVGVAKKEWLRMLPKINLPALILWASEDKTAPIKWAYQMNSLIKNSKISILEGYRHMGIMERPEYFAREICGFLKG